ncbi:MAG: hypothetical protein H6733_08320 [Alphaproteobacteria bacterium]|nr:hypothetical protein [Alphaproteobacteria bacterium]
MSARTRRFAAWSALWLSTGAHATTIKASSELVDDDGVKHPVSAAFDGKLQTAWAEGEMGTGDGSWIEIRFDKPTDVRWISVWPGDLSTGLRSLKEHGRPRSLTVQVQGPDELYETEVGLRDGAMYGFERQDIDVDVPQATWIRLTVDQAWGGYLRNDTYIAEVAINHLGGPQPSFDKVDAWVASSAGTKAVDKHRDEVIALFDRIDQAEFGDREALHQLMDWAIDGAPYLGDRVLRDVPVGYRISALPPDDVAVEALLKVKDPNAIPALQLAALRSQGNVQRKLEAAAHYFEAFASLKTGGRRSIDVWGMPGWEKGALQGFGEPLGIDQGVYGDLYLADTANNRITVFTPEGRTRATWGLGAADVTDVWFGGKRPYYVAGNEASLKPGGFFNPIDVDVVSSKESDEVWVLDAKGRVQWFDDQGVRLGGFKVPVEMAPAPGVGGAGHVRVTSRGIVVVIGNNGFVYDRDGNQLSTWTVEEGHVTTMAVLPNGRLALGFRRGAAEYDLGGFRHKTLLTGDELPLGYEAWSLAVDEKGKLWAVTDHGYVVKFKRPGKVEFSVRWLKVGSTPPRFTVNDGMLFIAADGRVRQVDALQLKDDADEAAAEE